MSPSLPQIPMQQWEMPVIPTWREASEHLCVLRTTGRTTWTVCAVATFDLCRGTLVPALYLSPNDAPPIDPKRVEAAIQNHHAGTDVSPILAGDEGAGEHAIQLGWNDAYVSTSWVPTVWDNAAWLNLCRFESLRVAELNKLANKDQVTAWVRGLRTTTPWSLLLPQVGAGLCRWLDISADLSRLEIALEALRRVESRRGRPTVTASLSASAAVLRMLRGSKTKIHRRDDLLGKLVRGSPRQISEDLRRFKRRGEQQVVVPLVLPFVEDRVPMPLDALASALGGATKGLTKHDLLRAVLAPSHRPPEVGEMIWCDDWTLPKRVELHVAGIVTEFTKRALQRWAQSEQNPDRLRVLCGEQHKLLQQLNRHGMNLSGLPAPPPYKAV